MNAPETAVTAPADAMVVARAPLDHFAPSLTNGNRHDGNKAYLEELAVTIKDWCITTRRRRRSPGGWADAGDHTETRTIRATVWYGRSYFAAASRHHRCQPIRPARHSRQSA